MYQKLIKIIKANWIFMLLFVFALGWRLIGIGHSTFNDDAHFWYTRSINFQNAVVEHEWAKTYQNAKPGVTLMWLAGFGYDLSVKIYSTLKHWQPPLYFADTYPKIHLMMMFPIIALICLGLLFFVKLIQNIYGRQVALITFVLLCFEPFLVGISQWMHVDALLTTFMLFSVTFMLLSFIKDKSLYFYLSAFFGGLALLTKTQAVYLFLFVPYSLFLKDLINQKKINLFKDLKLTIVWWLIAGLIFVILFPAMWVEAGGVVRRIYEEDFRVVSQGQNGAADNHGFLWYPYILLLRTTPLFILGFLAGMIMAIKKIKQVKAKERIFTIILVSFIGWYLLMMTIPLQKIDRYLLPILPIMAVFSAYFLAQLRRKWSLLLLGVGVFYCLTYFNGGDAYFSPLVGGRKVAERVYSIESKGEQLPRIGRLLNNTEYSDGQINPSDLVVVTTMIPQSLRPFFLGTVYSQDEKTPEGVTVDFALTPYNVKLPSKLDTCILAYEFYYHKDLWWTLYQCPQITLKED